MFNRIIGSLLSVLVFSGWKVNILLGYIKFEFDIYCYIDL